MKRLTSSIVTAVALCLGSSVATTGCGHSMVAKPSHVELLRKQARSSRDIVELENWFITELLEPKGSPVYAKQARSRIEQLGGPSTARGELAFAIDDHFHGRLKAAPNRYMRAAEKARLAVGDPQAETLAWTGVHYALDLKRNDPSFFERWKSFIQVAISNPMALGWRARGELTDLFLTETGKGGDKPSEPTQLERTVAAFGCIKEVRFAGPFGHGAARDLQRSFAAELPGPWPKRFTPEPFIARSPSQIATERRGCVIEAKDPAEEGIYYAETFIELERARDLIISVQGARSVYLDDTLVLDRDTRQFGIWPKFGISVRLLAGRHRLLAKLNNPRTSIRVVDPLGLPVAITTSTDGSRPYAIVPPVVGPDPNIVSRYVDSSGIKPINDALLGFAVSSLAEKEGQSDLASLLLEPQIKNLDEATGVSLLLAARFAEQDPLFAENQTRDLIRGLHEKAQKRDPDLWEPTLALLLFQAEQSGPKDTLPALESLVQKHPEVPGIIGSVIQLYRKLGWAAEYQSSVERMLERFPSDPDALVNGVELYDSRGKWAEADRLAKRILELDGDHEIELRRALAREDYPTAISELRRLGKRRTDRKDIAERISDVLERAGDPKTAFAQLADTLAKNPKDSGARHAKADSEFALGNRDALRRAIVDGLEAGADCESLQAALDLVEGTTELEPYRLNGKELINAFEASGQSLPGTAARVLDYSAIWVHADGSSRMLEHEIVRVQSAEAIRDFAEYQPPRGLLLHLRVIKSDGRTFEPLSVPSKPTVTFPHLEVGDYVETEVIVRTEGDGQFGKTYVGPNWFFREEKLAYARSELVVISPENRHLIVESAGNAPAPVIERRDGLEIRRFRVDASPAAPTEPYRPSPRETMPNVRLGWGADPILRLREFLDATAILTPMDPRIVRVAKRIVEGVKGGGAEQAKQLYHYVMDNVEEGEELDGRQIIMGRRGNRWRGFVELCRALNIPYAFGVAKNLLAPPPVGPLDAMGEYHELFLRLGDPKNPIDLVVGEKFTPFGYLPAEVRGAEGYLLDQDPPRPVRLTRGSTRDTFDTKLRGRLQRDGSATVEIEQTLTGKPAIMLRNIVAQAPETQLKSFVESRLISPTLQGGRLISFDFVERDSSDKALVLKTRVEVPRMAEKVGSGLYLNVPFAPRIGQLGALAARETPMVLDDSSDQTLFIALELPTGAKIANLGAFREFRHGDRSVTFKDRVEGSSLILERHTVIPAGRVPTTEYGKFAEFARQAGGALSAEIRIDFPR